MQSFRISFLIFGLFLLSLDGSGQTFSVWGAIKNKLNPAEKIPISDAFKEYGDSLDVATTDYIRLIFGHDTDSIALVEKQYGRFIQLTDYPINEAKYLYYIGHKHHVRSEFDSAMYYYEKSLRLIPESYPGTYVQKFRIVALCEMGLIQHEQYYDPVKALEYLQEAIERSDKYFYPGFRLRAQAYVSSIYDYQGELFKAISIAEEAIEHNAYNRAWDLGGADELYYVMIRHLISLYQKCIDCDDNDRGFELITQTLEFYRENDDIAAEACLMADLAVSYPNKVSTVEADAYMQVAIKLAKESGHYSVINYVNHRYADYLYKLGELKKSEEIIDDVKDHMMVSDLTGHIAVSKLLTKVYNDLGRETESIEMSKRSQFYQGKIDETYGSEELKLLQKEYELSNNKALVKLLKKRTEIIYSLTILSAGLLMSSFFLLGFTFFSRRKIAKQNIELQAANKSKNELFLILSHDLKGPISSFDNLGKRVSYLLQKKDYEGLAKFANYFSAAGDTLKYTVTSLLEWSLSQKDNFILEPEKISVKEEIELIEDELRYLTNDKNVNIQVISSQQVAVICDRNAFRIIYRNLIHNAVRNSENSSTVIINVRDNNMVEISIQNEVTDLTAKKVAVLRRTIENPQNAVSLNLGTSGIGLHTVSNLIRYNKGKISLDVKGKMVSIITNLPLSN